MQAGVAREQWMERPVGEEAVPACIEFLADYPALVSQVAQWHFDEWGHEDPGGSVESWTSRLRERCNRDGIPAAFVALQGSAPVGSSLVVAQDLSSRTDLSPWLAGVFVVASHRRQGIGATLVRRSAEFAARAGASTLYLHTSGAEAFYQRLGWQTLSSERHDGATVTVMFQELTA